MFSKDELKIIKGCLLTTKETFKCIPFKTNEIKKTMLEIDNLLKKFSEGS